MVQATITDIVSPAVAAEDPLATFDQELFHIIDLFQCRFAVFFSFQEGNDLIRTFAGAFAFSLVFFPFRKGCLQFRAGDVHSGIDVLFQQFPFRLFSQHHTETVFCVVFKEGCRPSRAMTLSVLGIAAVRCTTAPDAGAAVSVGDHHAVAEELGDDFTIRRFSTACAGAGEFEERLFELAADDGILIHRVGFDRQADDVIPKSRFIFFAVERFHGQCLFRADMGTAAAAQAVHDGYDDIVLVARSHFDFLVLVAFRSLSGFIRRHQERTDSSMGADEGTLVTADTFFSIPARYEHGDAAFFFGAGPRRPTAVFDAIISTDRQVVAFEGIDRNGEFAEEFRMFRHVDRFIDSISPGGRYIDLDDSRQALVDSFIVHVDDILAFLAIRCDDGFFQFRNSQVQRNDIGQFEEGRLHDHVDAAAETDFLSNADSVDDVEFDVVAGNSAF